MLLYNYKLKLTIVLFVNDGSPCKYFMSDDK